MVRAGSSQLKLVEGNQFAGVHHVAFGISPSDFEAARKWLKSRVEIIVVDGSDIIDGPDGWNSQSLYFLGPEDIVLELIARQADSRVSGRDGVKPRILSISEIGITTHDVPATVKELTNRLNLSTFLSQGAQFAPVGDNDGLLIESPCDEEKLSVTEQIEIATSSIR